MRWTATAECNEKRQQIIDDIAAFSLDLSKKIEEKVDLESKVINWSCSGHYKSK
ncbi:hypothetical protein OROMI_014069 [Orobanche minor]